MKKTDPECIFCKIVRREIPGDIVYEDDNVLAFNDIDPKAPTHILIIPKDHIPGVAEIEDQDREILGHILSAAREIASEKGLEKTGYRIVVNTGKDAGQAVFHIHFHLLGGRAFSWPPG